MKSVLFVLAVSWLALTLALGFDWFAIRHALTGGSVLDTKALLHPPVWPLLTIAFWALAAFAELRKGPREAGRCLALGVFACSGFLRHVEGLSDVGFIAQLSSVLGIVLAQLLPTRVTEPGS